ncbi:MAG TPA: peptidylprolyl isomerase [Draconibacterium sp.]|nr:peptidylprolyl isomerase [Draconibacterium sp.]
MKVRLILIALTIFVVGVSCGNAGKQKEDTLVTIQTKFGDIKVKLYDETPEHKNNFIKLVNEGFYNGLLFHRVIKNFMIQGGDPSSKGAEPGKRLGSGSMGYTIKAEFMPKKYFHKRGALAAARNGGPGNPEKRSSGSQFYIIQGHTFTNGQLDTLEMAKNAQLKNHLLKEYLDKSKDKLTKFRQNNDQADFNIYVAELRAKVDSVFNASDEKFVYTPEQRKVYTTIGGYPSLDGEYTVFGEVVDGMDVVDKIAEAETDQYNRPLENIIMQMKLDK